MKYLGEINVYQMKYYWNYYFVYFHAYAAFIDRVKFSITLNHARENKSVFAALICLMFISVYLFIARDSMNLSLRPCLNSRQMPRVSIKLSLVSIKTIEY